ncbi:helix-turn-helix domain-containing protein [Paenibacillus maysiensis]|uniref:helix-turn-helix domain-containing protein n=1 Tax=Paenibacillus maysiensis TaxID=1155954 RepID=UPI00047231AD|nr:helix-turn-helix transcriptional regulator [Paenibacillus maysiensis]
MSDLLKLVGARIRNLRKQRGLSQAKLAELSELQDSYIGGIERGERNISLKSIDKITSALEVEPVEIFRFGSLDGIEGNTEKHHVVEMHRSLLMERSFEEVAMIQRVVRDMLHTFDKEKNK